MTPSPPLTLASGSPRRSALLESCGISFTVQRPLAPEPEWSPGEDPVAYASRTAAAKCEEVAARCQGLVLAADTAVAVDGEVLGKPRDTEDGVRMLLSLSGRTHRVITAWCLAEGGAVPRTVASGAAITSVTFVNLDERTARAYMATGEPDDKAGAYAIQGQGAVLVKALEGSYTNVVGLPLAEVVAALEEHGGYTPWT